MESPCAALAPHAHAPLACESAPLARESPPPRPRPNRTPSGDDAPRKEQSKGNERAMRELSPGARGRPDQGAEAPGATQATRTGRPCTSSRLTNADANTSAQHAPIKQGSCEKRTTCATNPARQSTNTCMVQWRARALRKARNYARRQALATHKSLPNAGQEQHALPNNRGRTPVTTLRKSARAAWATCL